MTEHLEIGYCGLFCGDCVIRNGKIGLLSNKLLRCTRGSDFQKMAEGLPQAMPDMFETLKDFELFQGVLKAMTHLDCVKMCREGGGSTACRIRSCCQAKGFDGCWHCDEFNDCEIVDWLNPVHHGANIQHIIRIREIGIHEFLEEKKKRCPSSGKHRKPA